MLFYGLPLNVQEHPYLERKESSNKNSTKCQFVRIACMLRNNLYVDKYSQANPYKMTHFSVSVP